MSPTGGYCAAASPRSPNTIRSSTGWADAGVRATGVPWSTPRRVFSFDATHSAGSTEDTAIATSTSTEITTTGTVHRRCDDDGNTRPTRSAASASVSSRGGGDPDGGSVGGSVDVRVSVTLALSVDGLTVRAAFIAGLAIVALLLTGWRKPARAEPRSPRGPSGRPSGGIVVDHYDAPQYRRPGVVRRVLALLASGGIGILTGVLLAITVSFAVAIAVIWLTNLLQQ